MMPIFKSLASIGIGSATVDTRLESKQFHPGDTVKGEVLVKGGQAPQDITTIYLYLVADVSKGDKKTQVIIEKYQLSQPFTIQAEERKLIPFQVKLPMSTPMSTGNYPVYFKTGLDIKMAIDPTDLDKIEVFPTPLVQKLLKQVEDAGFILYRIHNEHDTTAKPHPFFQMFQFKPTGRYHGYVDELNIIFFVSEVSIHMEIEMIRSGRVLNSSFAWEYHDPNGTLFINDQKVADDPLLKIQEMLNRKPGNTLA
jgi:sporulation-control protein